MLSNAVFITCAVTGSGDSVRKNANVPVTPAQIATSALEAHSAGAAIVHIHVRDPASGAPSRDPALYREVCERIRASNDEVIVNLTGGMGGDLLLGPDDAPLNYGSGTDFVGPRERIVHIVELLPEIASLDCGSLNFDEVLYGTTPRYLRYMAQEYRRTGVRPEIEVFELGHIELACQLIAEGLIEAPALFQLCLGIKYGAPATTEAMQAMRDALPPGFTGRPLASAGCRCPWLPRPCCWAATCGWVWRITCTWRRACPRPTLNWWNARCRSWNCWARGCNRQRKRASGWVSPLCGPRSPPGECPQRFEPTGRGQLFARGVRGPQQVTAGDERTGRQLLEGAGFCEQEPLSGDATQRQERCHLGLVLDSFRHRVESEGLA